MTPHVLQLLHDEAPRLRNECRRLRFQGEPSGQPVRLIESEDIPADFTGVGASGPWKEKIYLAGIVAGFLWDIASKVTEDELQDGEFALAEAPDGTARFRFTLGGRVAALEKEVEKLRAELRAQRH